MPPTPTPTPPTRRFNRLVTSSATAAVPGSDPAVFASGNVEALGAFVPGDAFLSGALATGYQVDSRGGDAGANSNVSFETEFTVPRDTPYRIESHLAPPRSPSTMSPRSGASGRITRRCSTTATLRRPARLPTRSWPATLATSTPSHARKRCPTGTVFGVLSPGRYEFAYRDESRGKDIGELLRYEWSLRLTPVPEPGIDRGRRRSRRTDAPAPTAGPNKPGFTSWMSHTRDVSRCSRRAQTGHAVLDSVAPR